MENNFIYENTQNNCTSEYYIYISQLIKEILKDNLMIDVVLGNCSYKTNFKNTLVKVNINYEHTLVKKGGRGCNNHFEGGILISDKSDEKYLVRLVNFENLMKCDIIIDYSIPNIKNIESSNELNLFSKKLIYIAPVLYNLNIESEIRDINSLTSFINVNEPRRSLLLSKLNNLNISHTNINNCFEGKELKNILKRTKILLNIHQTEDHNTFEELRVLPALLCGVLVISEESPLKEFIPYSKYIIWTTYDQIINKLIEVSQNYDYYFNLIFNDTKDLENLHLNNFNNLKSKLETESLLNILSRKYILDKNININYPKFHNYIPGYNSLLKNIRNDVKVFLEIGIGSIENGQMSGVIPYGYKTANSLRCWRDYFPNSKIYGIDIFAHKIDEERIEIYQADQSNTNDLNRVVNLIGEKIDIIIDDGSHNPDHQTISFKFFEKYLSEKGMYIIEDVQPNFIDTIKNLQNFDEEYRNYIYNKYDILIFDTRSNFNRQDDFMIVYKTKSVK